MPQDRQPKAPPKPNVTKTDEGYVVVHQGVSVMVSGDLLNDYEFLEDSVGGGEKLPSVLRRMAGEDYDAVKESCRDRTTGRVLLEGPGSISEWMVAVLEAINPN